MCLGDNKEFMKNMNQQDLKEERRKIRNQLKEYDATFYKKHNRMPEKREKEPIRHLYEKYNSIRAQLESLRTDSSTCTISSLPLQKLLQPSNIPESSDSVCTITSSTSAKLEQLLVEKKELYHMLRSNERNFLKENNRPMSTYEDIKPVACHYRRYKEIKETIALLQSDGVRN